MATRGNTIFIKNCELKTKRLRDIEDIAYCIIYHHFDSYPKGVGEELKNAIKFSKDRIEDITYTTMNIINYITNKNKNDIKQGKLTGYGIDTEISSDIEWLYIINMTTQTLECYEMDFDDWKLGKLEYKMNFNEIYKSD